MHGLKGGFSLERTDLLIFQMLGWKFNFEVSFLPKQARILNRSAEFAGQIRTADVARYLQKGEQHCRRKQKRIP